MNNFITLRPISRINGIISLPGSKSISNRALLLAAQATGTTKLVNLLDSDDIHYMLSSLKKLGINYRLSEDRHICEIDGVGKALFYKKNDTLSLFLGNAGTAMRPLTAALCLNKHNIILTGEPRMLERPIGHLVNALSQGGAKIDYLQQKNYPPIFIHGGYLGGNITIDGSISSQFLTALLMMTPLAPFDSCIHISGKLVSRPYINITLTLMKKFGINIQHNNYQTFYVKGNNSYHSPGTFTVEGDASSASYFLAAAAIRGGTVKVFGIGRNSIQGDIRFADILENMGAIIKWGDDYIECSRGILKAIDMDFNHIPDAAMTIAITALFTNGGTTTLRNIYNWRVKETDRLTAMATELRRVGANIIEGIDYLKITPPPILTSANINTYNDHRMAMCFALTALSNAPITIINPQCIQKTFPEFFKHLQTLSTVAVI